MPSKKIFLSAKYRPPGGAVREDGSPGLPCYTTESVHSLSWFSAISDSSADSTPRQDRARSET